MIRRLMDWCVPARALRWGQWWFSELTDPGDDDRDFLRAER